MLLIDADSIVYSAGFSGEARWYVTEDGSCWENKQDSDHYADIAGLDPKKTRLEYESPPLENALYTTKLTLNSILSNFELDSDSSEYIVYLSNDKPLIREEVAKYRPYKGNRDKLRKPEHYYKIKDYIKDNYNWDEPDEGYEVDDLIAEIAKEGSVIIHIDKDLDQIPGMHYNWRTKSYYTVDTYTGLMNLYCQVLTGDNIDNVCGIKSVGPVRARKILHEDLNSDDAITALESCYYDPEAYEAILEMACRSAWIKYLSKNGWNHTDAYFDTEEIVKNNLQLLRLGYVV